MIIIGDVHGHYRTLKALVKKCPVSQPIVLAGDLIDRGPRSNKVIEWAIKTPNVTAILGNHDYMLQQYVEKPESLRKSWARNGGAMTLASYERANGEVYIPPEHVAFIRAMPLYVQTDTLVVTHAPMVDFEDWNDDIDVASRCLMTEWLWNRNPPMPRKRFQIYGHNSIEGLRFHGDYAVCIDTSASEILTAMHWPTKRIYQQPFID